MKSFHYFLVILGLSLGLDSLAEEPSGDSSYPAYGMALMSCADVVKVAEKDKYRIDVLSWYSGYLTGVSWAVGGKVAFSQDDIRGSFPFLIDFCKRNEEAEMLGSAIEKYTGNLISKK